MRKVLALIPLLLTMSLTGLAHAAELVGGATDLTAMPSNVRGGVVLFESFSQIEPQPFSIASQNFPDENFSAQGADDFVVTGNGWQVETVEVRGTYFNGAGPAESINIYILGNAASLPDTTNLSAGSIYAAENLSYTDVGSGDFLIDLPGAGVLLQPGTYWIVVQVNMDFLVGGQWGWTESGGAVAFVGAESAWFQDSPGFILSAGGLLTCLDAWGARVSTCDVTETPISPGPMGTTGRDLAFQLEGQQLAGITVNPTTLLTFESGTMDSFNVVLTAPPTAGNTVDVPIGLPDASEGMVSTNMLNFSAANWNIPQTVTVTGVDDAIADGNQIYTLNNGPASSGDVNYDSLAVADVSVTNNDDEIAGFTVDPVSGLQVSEDGTLTASFSVSTNTPPTDAVNLPLSVNNPGLATLSTANLVLPAGSTAVQMVTITGIDDDIDNGNLNFTVFTGDPASAGDAVYDALAAADVADVSVTRLDDDTAGITVTPTSGLVTTEAGGGDTFDVVLNSEPTMDVSIDLSSSDAGEGAVSSATLVFTAANWDTPQTVTVTGVDDDIDDGDVSYTIITAPAVSADGAYSGLDADDVSVSNQDDDTAGITVNPTAGLVTTEAGGSETFALVLNSEPTMDVSIGLSSSDAGEGTLSSATLVFTAANWDTPQTVTVTGVDDDIDDGDVTYTIVSAPAVSADGAYSGLDADDVAVGNEDDDTAGITVTPTTGLLTTEAGGSDTFDLVLDSEPTMDVSIDLSSNDASEGAVSAATVVFTAANWNTPQTVAVTGDDDAVVDGDQAYMVLTAAAVSADTLYSGINAADVAVTNQDDDTAGISINDVSVTEGTGANTTATFTVTLDTAVDGGFSVDYGSNDGTATAPADYTAVNATLNFVGTAGETQSIAVTVIGDSAFEPDETYTVDLGMPSNSAVSATDASGLGAIVDDDSADLAVALSAAPDPVLAGTQLTYTATVSNAGPANAAAVNVGLSIPVGAAVVSGSVSGGGSCTGAGPVNCSFTGPVVVGTPRSATVIVNVAPSVLMALSSTATVSTSTVDPNVANDVSSVSTAVSTAADLSLVMTIVPAEGVVGDFFILSATAINNGPSDAQDLAIAIDVPQGLIIINSNPSNGGLCQTTAPASGSVLLSCGYAGATVPGAQRSVEALLQSSATGLIVVNAAANSATSDPTANNNSSAAAVGAAVQQIPTLNPSPLALLALLLVASGGMVMRRD